MILLFLLFKYRQTFFLLLKSIGIIKYTNHIHDSVVFIYIHVSSEGTILLKHLRKRKVTQSF